jgi:hypothetical protein
MSAMKGKCLNILNIYEDNLWALGDRSLPVPVILPKPPAVKNSNEPDLQEKSELNQLEKSIEAKLTIDDKKVHDAETKSDEEESARSDVDHEKLMEECFLCSIKYRAKEFKLPIIISTFMKIMQSCS